MNYVLTAAQFSIELDLAEARYSLANNEAMSPEVRERLRTEITRLESKLSYIKEVRS